MKIVMVLETVRGYPPDIRVEKEARALDDAGISVVVMCNHVAGQPLEEPYLSRSKIVRVPVRRPPLLRRCLDAWTMRRSEWRLPVEKVVADEKPDAVHVHDLPLLPVVLSAIEPTGIPVVADFHENMPAAMRSYRSNDRWPMRLMRACLHNYRLMRFHEARAVRRCAAVVVVVPEASERIRSYGVDSDKIVLVSNTEDETTFPSDLTNADPAILDQYQGRWVASYIGGIGPHRGVDTAMRAVKPTVDKVPEFLLLIVGAKAEQQAQLAKTAKELGIEEHVSILGWQPASAVNSYVMASDACLVPHNDSEHTQTTIPHKLFQYMICGKPVIVSDCKPLARVVRECEAGLVFTAGDSASLSDRLVELRNGADDAVRYGQSGRASALGKFAWRHDARRLVELYQGLGAERSDPAVTAG